MIDIFLPFSFYFLLDNFRQRLFRWRFNALLVFALAALVETLQYFGYPIFAETFDPMDYFAYLAGVAMAVICDRWLFRRAFKKWQ
jgi:putative flippase GtrA